MLRKFVLYLLSAGLLAGCVSSSEAPQDRILPNVVLILTDDQGWGDLSIQGNINLETPNLDQLAREGAQFEHFYVCPVCSPTRAELLTGRYYPRGGVYSTSAGGERLDLDERTVAQAFQQAGYRTAAFGKWHNGMQYPYHPNARGFEEYYGFCSGHWGDYFSPMLEHNGEIVQGEGFLVDDLTNHAMDFIGKHKDEPFFVYLPYNTPHSPMQVPDRWWNRFKDKPLQMLHRDPEKEDETHTRAALAMCENIDWNVGRLLQKLEDLRLQQETIVIFLSDNGPNGWRWNGDMKGRKGSTDEGGVRSPLMIRWPGVIRPETRIKQIASAIDLLPTLTDLAGINNDDFPPLDGRSLVPLLIPENQPWSRRLVFNHWNGRTSVRSQEYLLDHEGALFDMLHDPGQRVDVASRVPAVADTLLRARKKWERTVLSELPEVDTRLFPVGHPDFIWNQLPARDAIAHGKIQRSNRWPNCSFYTHWTSLEDSLTWDVEVLAPGDFEATVYYTCSLADIGGRASLKSATSLIDFEIREAHDPPLEGMESDRVERAESYVKDFRPMSIGQIHLEAGKQQLVIKALEIPGEALMDFRLLMLKRL